jgi:C4-dicarboxylate-specific signal transduction histidine kinase
LISFLVKRFLVVFLSHAVTPSHQMAAVPPLDRSKDQEMRQSMTFGYVALTLLHFQCRRRVKKRAISCPKNVHSCCAETIAQKWPEKGAFYASYFGVVFRLYCR